MPYKVFSTNGKYAVHKIDEDSKPVGKPLGTHPSKAEADKQVAALYASEKKPKKEAVVTVVDSSGASETSATSTVGTLNTDTPSGSTWTTLPADVQETKELETKCYGDEVGYMPMGGPLTFADLAAEEAARDAAYEMHDLTHKFQRIAANIMTASDVEDKAAALTALANEYAGLVSEKAKLDIDKSITIAKQIAGDNQSATSKSTSQSTDQNLDTTDAPGGDSPSINSGQANEKTTSTQTLFIWKEDGVYRWIAAYSNNRRDDDNPPEIISSESHKEFDQALEKGEWDMPEAYLWHIPYPVGITTYHAYDETTGFPVAAGHFYKGMDWAAEGILKARWDGVSHGMPTEWIQRDADDPTIIIRHRTKEISFLPRWAAANKSSFNYVIKELEMEQKELPAHKRPNFVEAFGEDRAKQIEAALADKAKEADDAGIEKKEAAQPELTADSPLVKALELIMGEVVALRQDVDTRLKAIEAKEADPFDLVSRLKSQSAIGKEETKVDGRSQLAKDKPEEAQPITPTQQTVGVPVGLLDGLFQLNQGWYNGGKG